MIVGSILERVTSEIVVLQERDDRGPPFGNRSRMETGRIYRWMGPA
jgi:hypothetical protein